MTCLPTVLLVGLAAASCALAAGADRMRPWQYHSRVRVAERAGVAARSFPVSFTLQADRLVAEGKLQPDARDLRLTVAGREAPFQTEPAARGDLRVTFPLDLEPGQRREDIVLHYGNPKAKAPSYDSSWGCIAPTRDGFENEVLRAGYGLKKGTFGSTWPCQTQFVLKQYGEDQFGGDAVPDSWAKDRNDVTYWERDAEEGPTFEVLADGPVYKRVRFHAYEKTIQHHPGAPKTTVKDLSQTITFYRGCPFLQEELRNLKTGITTTATPGGMPLRTPEGERNFDFAAHDFDSDLITWQGRGEDTETRGGWTADRKRAQQDPRYRFLDDYAYRGYLILGVVNVHNGRGIGTAVSNVKTAFFVDWHHERAGFSVWPTPGGNMTRYLYLVEGGREQVIELGKLLANPPEATFIH